MRALLIGGLALASVCALSEPAWAASQDAVESGRTAEAIPYKEQPAVDGGAIQRVVLVLLLAIGICFVAAFWLRKEFAKRGLLTGASSDRISVVASRRIAPRLTVFLVKVDDQAYVMAQNGTEVQLVPHVIADSSKD